MTPMHGERLLLEKETLMLTSLRVRSHEIRSGEQQIVSITLDCVASCGLVSRSTPVLLTLGALALLLGAAFGFMGSPAEATVGTLLLGAALVAAFFTTRSVELRITSMGGDAITSRAKSFGNPAAVLQIIEAVEAAKLARLAEMRRGG